MKLLNTTYRIAQSAKKFEETSSPTKSKPEGKSAVSKDQFTKVTGASLKMEKMIQGVSSEAGLRGSGADVVSAQPIDLPRTAQTTDSKVGLKGSRADLVSAQRIDLPRVAQSAKSVNGVKGSGGGEVSATPIDLPRTAQPAASLKNLAGDQVSATTIDLPHPAGDGKILSVGEFVATLPIPIPQPVDAEAREIEKDWGDLEAMRLNAAIREKRSRLELLSNVPQRGQDSKTSTIRNLRS